MASPSELPDDLISVPAAAARLGVNPSTVWRWVDGGVLQAIRIGPRSLRVRVRDVMALVRASGEGSTAAEHGVEAARAVDRAEIDRRKALVERILAHRQRRVVTPNTAADLVRRGRERELNA
jgi:excisionase family DNA binding protein